MPSQFAAAAEKLAEANGLFDLVDKAAAREVAIKTAHPRMPMKFSSVLAKLAQDDETPEQPRQSFAGEHPVINAAIPHSFGEAAYKLPADWYAGRAARGFFGGVAQGVRPRPSLTESLGNIHPTAKAVSESGRALWEASPSLPGRTTEGVARDIGESVGRFARHPIKTIKGTGSAAAPKVETPPKGPGYRGKVDLSSEAVNKRLAAAAAEGQAERGALDISGVPPRVRGVAAKMPSNPAFPTGKQMLADVEGVAKGGTKALTEAGAKVLPAASTALNVAGAGVAGYDFGKATLAPGSTAGDYWAATKPAQATAKATTGFLGKNPNLSDYLQSKTNLAEKGFEAGSAGFGMAGPALGFGLNPRHGLIGAAMHPKETWEAAKAVPGQTWDAMKGFGKSLKDLGRAAAEDVGSEGRALTGARSDAAAAAPRQVTSGKGPFNPANFKPNAPGASK